MAKTKEKKPKARPVKMPKMWLETVAIDKLLKWKQNPRDNEGASVKLAGLIEAHGYRVPIIASYPDKVIRAGHTRLKALELKGVKKVTVLFQKFDSESQARAFSIADNRSNEWASWNLDKLKEIFEGFTKEKVDFNLTGFSVPEVNSLIPDLKLGQIEPGIPEIPIEGEKEGVGDYFIIQFDSPKECDGVRKAMGLSKNGRVISWKNFKKVYNVTKIQNRKK